MPQHILNVEFNYKKHFNVMFTVGHRFCTFNNTEKCFYCKDQVHKMYLEARVNKMFALKCLKLHTKISTMEM